MGGGFGIDTGEDTDTAEVSVASRGRVVLLIASRWKGREVAHVFFDRAEWLRIAHAVSKALTESEEAIPACEFCGSKPNELFDTGTGSRICKPCAVTAEVLLRGTR